MNARDMKRIEYVDRILESLDKSNRRKGQPRQRFTLTRSQFREHLCTAYNNGAVITQQRIKGVIKLMNVRVP
jgi:hypothetical protein